MWTTLPDKVTLDIDKLADYKNENMLNIRQEVRIFGNGSGIKSSVAIWNTIAKCPSAADFPRQRR